MNKKSYTKLFATLCLGLFIALPALAQHKVRVGTKKMAITNIYFKKGENLFIAVTGTWTFKKPMARVNHQGHNALGAINQYGNLGVLLGQIGEGDPFIIQTGGSLIAKNDGRLKLFANISDQYMSERSAGVLNVLVRGGKKMSSEALEKLAGWDLAKLNTANGVPGMRKVEKEMVILLNKARTNPTKFAKEYLTDIKLRDPIARELYLAMLETKPMGPIKPEEVLLIPARRMAQVFGTKGKEKLNGKPKYATMLAFNRSTSLDVLLDMLLDKELSNRLRRKQILNPEFKSFGVGFHPHTKYRYIWVMMYQ
ncbi:MAG TPA: hypothetical protein DCS93_16265 [Microscillaceae bacterium]|nr:hypothetical protein [Microscillaceae bacterium]